MSPKIPPLETLLAGVRSDDRVLLAKAITLVESSLNEHQNLAGQLLLALLPDTGGAHRIGITGVPGVGKSTLIETLGLMLTQLGKKVAVLAVDPSSSRTGGAILGDKTRMQRLSAEKTAFIRPSPSSGTLGGVARKTRETMALCEAAGFDVILVETVGVGQSEIAVAHMVDCFVCLMLPGAGDDLQGLKKGVLELADIITVNKADGEGRLRAEQAAGEYRSALQILSSHDVGWLPPVLTVSGLGGDGVTELWHAVEQHKDTLENRGEWESKRRAQAVQWMHDMVDDKLHRLFKENERLAELTAVCERDVRQGHLTAGLAAERIFAALLEEKI